MDEQPCPPPRLPAHHRPACGTFAPHPPPAPATSGSADSTDTAMDLPDDPLGMGPPERGVFDWLVPDAGEGAESRVLPPGPLAGHPGAPPVRAPQFFKCRRAFRRRGGCRARASLARRLRAHSASLPAAVRQACEACFSHEATVRVRVWQCACMDSTCVLDRLKRKETRGRCDRNAEPGAVALQGALGAHTLSGRVMAALQQEQRRSASAAIPRPRSAGSGLSAAAQATTPPPGGVTAGGARAGAHRGQSPHGAATPAGVHPAPHPGASTPAHPGLSFHSPEAPPGGLWGRGGAGGAHAAPPAPASRPRGGRSAASPRDARGRGADAGAPPGCAHLAHGCRLVHQPCIEELVGTSTRAFPRCRALHSAAAGLVLHAQ